MTTAQFIIVWVLTLATMLACRIIPIFVLKGRELPDRLKDALSLIPPAAFAALVANDLLDPGMFSEGLAAGIVPLMAATVVVVVAKATKSLIWCAAVGVAAYALFTLAL